jgi:uncharacterized protein YkwD
MLQGKTIRTGDPRLKLRLASALLLALALPALADDASELADRLKKLAAEEATRRLPLAEHCEKCKMWKEADTEYARLLDLAPENASVQEKAKKAAEMAEISQARPAKGEQEQYRAGALALARDMSKKYWELAIWASSKGLREDAERVAGLAEKMDEALGAESPQSKKFYEGLYPQGDERKRSVDVLNEHRKRCGLKPVVFSATISQGAQRHAEYLIRNDGHPSTEGLGAHDEDPSLPGYTPEGARAGKASDIGQVPPVPNMVNMLGTFYHRVPLLHPDLKKIGVGWKEKADGKGFGWGVIDCNSGVGAKDPSSPRVVVYPADGQKDVQRMFDNELPDPIPPGEDHDCGTAITISWFREGKIGGGDMKVRIGGEAVDGYLSTPERPARKDHGNGSTICFIPKDALPANAKVEVSATATVDGKPFTKSWSFTTGTHNSEAWKERAPK